jgi:hypothetical protein
MLSSVHAEEILCVEDCRRQKFQLIILTVSTHIIVGGLVNKKENIHNYPIPLAFN